MTTKKQLFKKKEDTYIYQYVTNNSDLTFSNTLKDAMIKSISFSGISSGFVESPPGMFETRKKGEFPSPSHEVSYVKRAELMVCDLRFTHLFIVFFSLFVLCNARNTTHNN